MQKLSLGTRSIGTTGFYTGTAQIGVPGVCASRQIVKGDRDSLYPVSRYLFQSYQGF